jgi:uncharacterized membrane protein
MELAILILGLVIFLGGHGFVSLRPQRAALIARVGHWPYMALFSLVSLIGIGLIVYGFGSYRAGGMIEVWSPPTWTRHVTALLVWPAIICMIAAYVPSQIKRVLKHPMLVGVKLWALAHLIANGDLGSIILFGSFLAWAVLDRIAVKHRGEPAAPPVPVDGFKNDFIVVVAGTLVYFALGLWFHPWVIGVPVFGS